MTGRAPRVSGKQVVAALNRVGWYVSRQRGSHVVLEHSTRSGIVVVPVHGNETLQSGTLRSILGQAGITVEKFRSLL